jgi:hypothetical protein
MITSEWILILIKKKFGQDLQDLLDLFFVRFPEESGQTQSPSANMLIFLSFCYQIACT